MIIDTLLSSQNPLIYCFDQKDNKRSIQKLKLFLLKMIKEMPQIKITSFKRLDYLNTQTTQKLFFVHNDSFHVNALLYTEHQNHKTKQLETWIRKEQKDKINFLKLLQEKSVTHAICSLLNNEHRKTFLITNKPFTAQIQNLIKTNSSYELTKIIQKLNIILLVDQVQEISPENFHLKNISLITTEVQTVKKIIETEIQKNESKDDLNELSSMNSQIRQDFEARFKKSCNLINLPSKRNQKYERIQQVVVNDNPGVGQYNISSIQQRFKGSNLGTFSRQKR